MDISQLGKRLDFSEGEWIGGIPDHPGLRLKVRSLNYKPFQAALQRLLRETEDERGEGADEEANEEFLAASGGLYAIHLLLDWDMSKATGLFAVTDNGEPLSYSAAAAGQILSSTDDLNVGQAYRNAVLFAARKVNEKALKKAKAVTGNSQSASSGSKSTARSTAPV